MTAPRRVLGAVPPGLAIVIGGNLWMAREFPFLLDSARFTTQPALFLIAVVLGLAAPTVAARPLLRTSRAVTDLPGEKVACLLVPTLTTLLVAPFYVLPPLTAHLGWWTQFILPLGAAVTGRWGLRAGLTAVLPACALTALLVAAQETTLATWVSLLNVSMPPIGWVLATHFLIGMLRGQADQTRALRGASMDTETRRAQTVEVLNAVPAEFLARIRPTLARIISGERVDDGLRAECAALEKQVRTELAARRLLTEDGPALVRRLQSSGWLIRIQDQGPIRMPVSELERVRAVTLQVLRASARSGASDGTISIRMPSGRFLATVVVTGPGALEVSRALSMVPVEHTLDADAPDEEPVLYAEMGHSDGGKPGAVLSSPAGVEAP